MTALPYLLLVYYSNPRYNIGVFIAILGRQPEIGIAELERVHQNVSWFSDNTALFDAESPDIQKLGGSQKLGKVILQLNGNSWMSASMKLVKHYEKYLSAQSGKVTLGISAYGFDAAPKDIQKTGLILKGKIKSSEVSLRLIPNADVSLNTASSHHNKLGLAPNKIEILVVRGKKGIVIAESIGSQNITALARRDQGRPKRDAFVGMLPPKLAQIMINLAGYKKTDNRPVLLDPFCGTGVVLQEAMLMRYSVYGSDLSEKMVRYSRDNLNWLQEENKLRSEWYLHEGDATDTKWRQPIDLVVAETYLGQPFSAPPSRDKLEEVKGNCNHIISGFLKNLSKQIPSGTPVCIAVPAWRDSEGNITHLPLTRDVTKLGYELQQLQTVSNDQLIYFRPDQVVARQILILQKA